MKEYKAKLKNDNVIIDLEENTFRIHYVKNLVELENSIIDKIPSIFGVNKIENDDEIIKYEDISEIKTNTPLLGYSKISFLQMNIIFYEFEGLHKNEVKEIEQFIKDSVINNEKKSAEAREKEKNRLLELKKLQEEVQKNRDLQYTKEQVKTQNNTNDDDEKGEKNKKEISVSPPPPPVFGYYAMIENKQQGPYNKIQFKRLVDNNLINKASLVWKEGMSKWEKAKEVEDMEEFFTQENPNTPPIPPAGPATPPPPVS